MENKIAIHAYVSGRVQGVFYRDATQKKATELGVTGWVKNIPDGRVELIACGDQQLVNELIEWLWEGSRSSNVTSVETKFVDYTDFESFKVTR